MKRPPVIHKTPNPKKAWTILELIKWTSPFLQNHHVDNPRLTAEILLAHVLNVRRIDLYLSYDQPLSQDELACYKSLIKRRVTGEPVAYIIGYKEFWSLRFQVTGDVLIPRPETEFLVETALQILTRQADAIVSKKDICELGVGSGAVSVALAYEAIQQNVACHFFASDRSASALRIARKNSEQHNVAHCMHFFAGNWLDSIIPHSFDMILSNPPYIKSQTIPHLQTEICRFEPLLALDGGDNGLEAIKNIIDNAHVCLKDNGHVLLEIGYDQKDAVHAIAESAGSYRDIDFIKDYSGHDRVVKLCKKPG